VLCHDLTHAPQQTTRVQPFSSRLRLVPETPIRAIGKDLVRTGLDHALFAQPKRIEAYGVLRVVAARFARRGRTPWRRSPAFDRASEVYSITSSVRASSVIGGSKPSALAVFRLITSWNLVACCTGRSAGVSPFRMRPT
jgi:hypothetical protein